MKDIMKATGIWFYVFVIFIVTCIVGGFVYYAVMPYAMNKETQIIRNTNQYVTTGQTGLTTFKADYDKLEVKKAELSKADAKGNAKIISAMEAQQAGIVRQMKQICATLRPEQIPPDIQAIISTQ